MSNIDYKIPHMFDKFVQLVNIFIYIVLKTLLILKKIRKLVN